MSIMKIVFAGVAITALMVVAQDRNWPQKVGVISVCGATAAPVSAPNGYWYSCKEGIVNGFPNLEGDNCTTFGIVHRREVWRCNAPVRSLPGA